MQTGYPIFKREYGLNDFILQVSFTDSIFCDIVTHVKKSGLESPGKENDMITLISCIYLDWNHESLGTDLEKEQGFNFMCRNQVKQYRDLCECPGV